AGISRRPSRARIVVVSLFLSAPDPIRVLGAIGTGPAGRGTTLLERIVGADREAAPRLRAPAAILRARRLRAGHHAGDGRRPGNEGNQDWTHQVLLMDACMDACLPPDPGCSYRRRTTKF